MGPKKEIPYRVVQGVLVSFKSGYKLKLHYFRREKFKYVETIFTYRPSNTGFSENILS